MMSKPTETNSEKQEILYKSEKADLPNCTLYGCNKIGILEVRLKIHEVQYGNRVAPFIARFCCKTHMLRHLAKIKMPRYSLKAVQRMATTLGLKFVRVKGVIKKKATRNIYIGEMLINEDIKE